MSGGYRLLHNQAPSLRQARKRGYGNGRVMMLTAIRPTLFTREYNSKYGDYCTLLGAAGYRQQEDLILPLA